MTVPLCGTSSVTPGPVVARLVYDVDVVVSLVVTACRSEMASLLPIRLTRIASRERSSKW